uniref:C-type lectin domain-containing protein n=1 Tax=Panagrellus redivivus TaxID=6233 RepID=A0A7E4V1M8_PANRE
MHTSVTVSRLTLTTVCGLLADDDIAYVTALDVLSEEMYPCLGQDNCYPLAFGVPAVLMIVATVLFVAGGFAYVKKPPQENVIFRVVSVVKTALKNKWNRRTESRNHWLEHYLDTHDCKMDTKCVELQESSKDVTACAETKFISDIRSLIRVIIMMAPVPFFWALYDQQSSVWMIQAVSMDVRITKGFKLLPDQMNSVNAILIMVFIPLFQFIIYPVCRKIVKLTDLRKMAVGGMMAAVAFIVAGFVQLGVNQTLPNEPPKGHAYVSFINAYSTNCNVIFTIGENSRTLGPNSALVDDKITNRRELLAIPLGDYSVKMTFLGECLGVQNSNHSLTVRLSENNVYYIAATPEGAFYSETDTKKPTSGRGESKLRLTLLTPCSQIQNATVRSWGCSTGNDDVNTYFGRIAICGYNPQAIDHPCDPRDKSNYHYYAWKTPESDFNRQRYQQFNGANFVEANGTAFEFTEVNEGRYRAYYVNYLHADSDRTPAKEEIEVYPIPDIDFEVKDVGGVYALTAAQNGRNSQQNVFNIWTIVPPNHCSIMLQIPQYVILTASEILFTITGLEFCYSQAAPSMKSVVQAIWLLTVAVGDLIIIVITEADFTSNVATSLFAYAAAMIVVMVVFILLSIFYYDYVDYTSTTSPVPTSPATSGHRSEIYDNISRISEKQL